MDIKKNNLLLSNGFSLIPLLVFLVVYISAGIWFALLNEPMAFYQFPAASCAFFGFFAALILGYKNTQEHINTFISSIADSTVILMCLVFLLAGAFSALAKSIGCIDATVNLGIYLLPDRLLLPGLFLVSCFVSFSMGTSMGTISTIMPIAIGFSTSAEISMPLVAATVVGGAMFGDNLSVISDTTIAATSTQECGMREKMVINSKIAFLAAFLVCIILFFMGKSFEKKIGRAHV